MKTLGLSYLNIFTCTRIQKERLIWGSKDIAFVGINKRVRDAYALAVSIQHKYGLSISADLFSQTVAENEEIQTVYSYHQPNTVHVKFKLKKKCAFGQRFSIVGDDPVLGLWNPCDGVPLNWSEEHVWTVEMDIPSGKLIKYKFILMMDAQTILWQPGQDRLLETCATRKTIIVSEDWDDPELQNIVEEEHVRGVYEEPSISSDPLVVANDVSQAILEKGPDHIEELANTNGHANVKREPSEQMVAGNITEERVLSYKDKGPCLVTATEQENGNTLRNDGQEVNGSSNLLHSKDEEWLISETATEQENGNTLRKDGQEVNGSSNLLHSKDEEWLISDDGIPILVPDSVLLPEEHTEAADINHVATETELKEEHASTLLSPVETQDVMTDEKKRSIIKEQIARDMRWGQRTLQKLLANLGFE